MRRLGIALLSVTLITLGVRPGLAEESAQHSQTKLLVRVYDTTETPVDARQQATGIATAILGEAGIESEWHDCALASPYDAVCSSPVGDAEVIVRMVRYPVPIADPQHASLGYSLVDASTGAGSLATIYLDRVAWLADASRINLPTLVGRAIAHEIGHLLLGSTYHGRAGLMRAVWSRDELMKERSSDWRFSAAESAWLGTAVQARLGFATFGGSLGSPRITTRTNNRVTSSARRSGSE